MSARDHGVALLAYGEPHAAEAAALIAELRSMGASDLYVYTDLEETRFAGVRVRRAREPFDLNLKREALAFCLEDKRGVLYLDTDHDVLAAPDFALLDQLDAPGLYTRLDETNARRETWTTDWSCRGFLAGATDFQNERTLGRNLRDVGPRVREALRELGIRSDGAINVHESVFFLRPGPYRAAFFDAWNRIAHAVAPFHPGAYPEGFYLGIAAHHAGLPIFTAHERFRPFYQALKHWADPE